MRFYLDSNVFISFVRQEIDGAFNLRFSDAEKFFTHCRSLKTEVVVSELFFQEVKDVTALDRKGSIETLDYLGINFLVFENAEKKIAIKISKETGVHFSDALHIANAMATNCSFIITWNKRDFTKAKNFISPLTPQELLQLNA